MQSLWMVVAAVFYAVYGVCIKFASLEGIGAWEVLFYRSFFGLVVFFIMMHREGTSMRTQHPWAHAVRSLAGVAAIVAGIYSLSHLNLGLAMTLNYTAPLFLGTFVVIWSLLHHSHINWGLMASLAAGFAGVVILLGPTIGPDEYFAAGVGIAAGGFTALATGFVKRLGSYHEPLSRIIFFLMLAGSVCGLSAIPFTGGFHAWTATGAASILAFCVCATLGQLTLTMAFSRGNMVLSGALQYTVILFSTLMGVLIFGDDVSFTSAVGMVTIVVSGIAASLLTKRTEGHIKAIKKLKYIEAKSAGAASVPDASGKR